MVEPPPHPIAVFEAIDAVIPAQIPEDAPPWLIAIWPQLMAGINDPTHSLCACGELVMDEDYGAHLYYHRHGWSERFKFLTFLEPEPPRPARKWTTREVWSERWKFGKGLRRRQEVKGNKMRTAISMVGRRGGCSEFMFQ